MENHKNIYELRFEHGIAIGLPIADAAIAVVEAYLDGKPARRGKHPFRAVDKNAAFWSCQFLEMLSADLYETELFVLALARYMGQQQTANFELVRRIAKVAPEAVRRAVRYSGLVLRQNSERWKEVERLAITEAAEFSEFIRVCHRFDHAHRDRVAEVEVNRKLLDDLSPLDLLSYASLYAFEHMVPEAFNQISKGSDTNIDSQEIWDAINDILVWKLQTCAGEAFHLTDATISGSLRVHLSPLLFPSMDSLMFREDIHLAFGYLVSAHLELNSFLSRSVHAFCYDDSIRFEFADADLVIIEHDPDASSAWIRNGEKLARLHGYWYCRAMDEFVSSGMATKRIGRPENHEINRFAYIKAIRTKLQLSEVYGLGDLVLADTGLQVDLFQALLSLELMTAFYTNYFILPYGEHLNDTGHWRSALTLLAIGGLLQPESQNQFHNRFPFTWSDRAVKIESIRPWTVSEAFPHGNAKAAEAILDFWTSDLGSLSAQLRGGGPILTPDLFERPVLKMGRYLFQLPWMLAMQNNASAAINNLRRIGARRTGAKCETQRIENRLATLFKERGFHVCLNYQPEKTFENDPGEIDIICARDGQLLVLEIKSTFLRRSVKDAWLHKTTTLRKAGLQLRRKVEAVKAELASNAKLALSLGIEPEYGMPLVRGWIVDTCIEHDHEFFSGFLKVSLEEVLIALRDDRHLLNDPAGWLTDRVVDVNDGAFLKAQVTSRLYPDGFSGGRFIDVILRQTVWATSSENG